MPIIYEPKIPTSCERDLCADKPEAKDYRDGTIWECDLCGRHWIVWSGAQYNEPFSAWRRATVEESAKALTNQDVLRQGASRVSAPAVDDAEIVGDVEYDSATNIWYEICPTCRERNGRRARIDRESRPCRACLIEEEEVAGDV